MTSWNLKPSAGNLTYYTPEAPNNYLKRCKATADVKIEMEENQEILIKDCTFKKDLVVPFDAWNEGRIKLKDNRIHGEIRFHNRPTCNDCSSRKLWHDSKNRYTCPWCEL